MEYLSFANERQNRIRQFVSFYRYVTIPMLQAEFFRFKSGLRKAQEVMQRMTVRKEVRRFRVGRQYIYHLEQRTDKWRHWYEINRFHFRLLSRLKPWQKVILYEREYVRSYGRSDALYEVQTILGHPPKRFYLEVDLDSGNAFDKAQNYFGDDLVVVVTVRPEQVKRILEKEGYGGRWLILSLEDDPGVILRGG